MARKGSIRSATDEELVAYFDGELAPDRRAAVEKHLADESELRRRLELMIRGGRPFRQVFDLMLQDAPTDRLEAILENTAAAAGDGQAPAGRAWPLSRAASVAAALALFLAGMGVGSLVVPLKPPPAVPVAEQPADRSEDWRQAVAGYLSLYTSETLANVPDDAAVKEQELAAVADKLGLSLTLDRIDLANVEFKRAQLFDYEGKSLVQLAYLDPDFGPVAFCIIADGDESEPARTEERLGMNIVYWAQQGYGFMVIGRAPADRLRPLADSLAARLSS
ncbi:MAG: zf-HC2 domain-containing protein [Hyphomicrobiales bacterium]|nr:zf-HC2 domain-containing protein [Hyphomicrobiales bacterium]